VNAHQCHLAVFYTCLAGGDFQASLPGKGVECVVGADDVDLYNGGISITWFQTFWQVLKCPYYTVQQALNSAREEVRTQHPNPPPDATAYWNTDWISATEPDHKVVKARYE